MGDILHTHERLHTVPLKCATFMYRMISRLRPTYVLVGNHDFTDNAQILTDNHWMNSFKDIGDDEILNFFRSSGKSSKAPVSHLESDTLSTTNFSKGPEVKEYNNLTIVDNIHTVVRNNIKFTLCPYVPDEKFRFAMDTRKGEWEDSRCIFAHQLFGGAKMGAIVAENAEKWDEKLPPVVSGHIHDKQQVQSNIIYTGSSLQHAFGESADKTLLLVTLHLDEPLEFKEIDLQLPKKKILYMEMDELEDFDINTLEPGTEYKLTVDGSYEEFEAFKKTVKYKTISKRAKVIFKHKRSFIQEKKERVNDIKEKKEPQKSFKEILEELVTKEEDQLLSDLLNTIVFNRHVENTDDIIIIEDESDEE